MQHKYTLFSFLQYMAKHPQANDKMNSPLHGHNPLTIRIQLPQHLHSEAYILFL